VSVDQSPYYEIGIVNVGQGAAVDVDLDLHLPPERWRRAGSPALHLAADPARADLPVRAARDRRRRASVAEGVGAVYPRVELAGAVLDQLDNAHPVSVALPDAAGLFAGPSMRGWGPRRVAPERQFEALSQAATAIASTLKRSGRRLVAAPARNGGLARWTPRSRSPSQASSRRQRPGSAASGSARNLSKQTARDLAQDQREWEEERTLKARKVEAALKTDERLLEAATGMPTAVGPALETGRAMAEAADTNPERVQPQPRPRRPGDNGAGSRSRPGDARLFAAR